MLSDTPWMLLICAYFPDYRSRYSFYYFLCSSGFLAVIPSTLTLTNRQPHTDTCKHTLQKELQENAEADHIMQITVACWDVHGIRKEMNRRIEGRGGGEAHRAVLRGGVTYFQKVFCSWPPPIALHACLAVATDRVTCHWTSERSAR